MLMHILHVCSCSIVKKRKKKVSLHVCVSGNGYIAASFDSQNGLYIRLNRALSLPVKYYPVVETTIDGLQKEGNKLTKDSKDLINNLPNNKILDWSKLKAFSDDKCDLRIKICDNIVGKGENAGYHLDDNILYSE